MEMNSHTERKKSLDCILKEQETNSPDTPELSILVQKPQTPGRIDLVTPEPQSNRISMFNELIENGAAISTEMANGGEIQTEIPDSVRCTACNKNLKLKKKKICKHPRLSVLLCKSCLKFINSNDFKTDEMGVEEFCTWCGDGGNLVCCDYCEKAYCKHCIKRNLGKPFLKYLLEASDDLKWKCFNCDQKQILPYVQECNIVLKHLSRLHMLESTMDVNKTHVSGLSQIERMRRLNEVSKKVADAPNSHVGMRNSFTTIEIDSDTKGKINHDKQDQSATSTINNDDANDTSILNKSTVKAETLKEVETNEKGFKKKKQTIVVVTSDEDSDEEIVVVSKSGKKTILNKSLLMAAQALLKNKNLDKHQEASRSDSSNKKDNKKKQEKGPKNLKKSLGNFMRLSLNTNEKDSEESCQSTASSSDSDTPPERSDSSDDSSDNDSSDNEGSKHKKKKASKKKSQKLVPKKEPEIIDGVVFDDEQPGPSGIRPKNKMQKLREKTTKKQVIDSSDEEFIPDLQSLQEQRKEENKKIISKINSPDLDDDLPDGTAGSKSKKIMSHLKNSTEEPKNVAVETTDSTTAKSNVDSSSKLNVEGNVESSNNILINDSPENELTDTNDSSEKKDENLLTCTVKIQKLSDASVRKISKREEFSETLLSSPSETSLVENTVDMEVLDEENSDKDQNKSNVADTADKEEEEENENIEENEDSVVEVIEKRDEYEDEQENEDEVLSEKPQKLRRSKRKPEDKSNDSSDTKETVKRKKTRKAETDDNSSDDDNSKLPPKRMSEKRISKKSEVSESEEVEEDNIKPEKRKSKRLQKKESIDVSSGNEQNESSKKSNKKLTKKRKDCVDVTSGDSDDQISRSKRVSKNSKKRKKLARLNSNDSSVVSPNSSESEEEQHADTISSDSSSEGSIIITKKKKKEPVKKKRHKNKNSDDEDNDDSDSQLKTPTKGRKKIRKILKDSQLTEETKRARDLEEQRRKRLLQRTQAERLDIAKVLEVCDGDFVLERNEKKEPLIFVDEHINKHLKPHQRNGIKFMYDCTIESIKSYKKGEEGDGCLLAHCMGLGKTLQIVSFIHTCYKNENIKMRRFLVVAPLNTVLNWEQEFDKWLHVDERMDVFVLSYCTNGNKERMKMIKEWFTNGGVLICGYEMYRNLVNYTYVKSKKMKEAIKQYLVDPGPQLIVCDEGHVLRNSTSAISIAMNNIKTKRRIVLTGTPLQNNLPEYHVMVDFVKPKLLGTKKEFQNRFVNPISNGRCSNSTPRDVKVMKQRCHVLYQLLSGCVQRQDYSVLTPFLPPKREYTIMVRLTEKQITMYKHYLNDFVFEGPMNKFKGNSLFSDFHCLSRIWSHPWSLHLERIRQYARNRYKDEEEFIDDEDDNDDETSESDDNAKKPWNEDTSSDEESDKKRRNRRRNVISSDSDNDGNSRSEEEQEKEATPIKQTIAAQPRVSTRRTRAAVKEENKIRPMNMDDDDGDDDVVEVKTIGSLRSGINFKDGTLNPENDPPKPEYEKEWYDEFLKEEDEHNVELSGKLVLMLDIIANAEVVKDKVLVFTQSLASLDLIESALGGGEIHGNQINWCHGIDYFRMDGSTPVNKRKRWSDIFNDPDNERCRLFLISTKAGSLGINMVAANRVVIFDCSWNPSHDVQSVFRVYRFGQEKPVYVYRLVAQGTMEEKVYDRQIMKLAVASRVVDEMQIERHFTDEEIRELYTFKPDQSDISETPQLPKDPVLAEVLQRQHPKYIVRYHEHDLLLENVAEEEMTEEEKKLAWKSYEDEKEMASRALQYRTMPSETFNFQTMYEQQQQQVNSRLLNMSTIRIATPVSAMGGANASQTRYLVRLPNGTHQITSHPPTGQGLISHGIHSSLNSEQQFRVVNMASLGNSFQRVSNPSNVNRVYSTGSLPQSMQAHVNNIQPRNYQNVQFTTNNMNPVFDREKALKALQNSNGQR